MHKGYAHGDYIPLYMVGVIIYVKNFLTLAQSYLGLPPVGNMDRIMLEQYLSSWESAKQTGILTCDENTAFDGSPESLPIFRIEPTGILIQHGLLELFSLASGGGGGTPPTRICSQSGWKWYVRWRRITLHLGGRCMKGIWMASSCGPG